MKHRAIVDRAGQIGRHAAARRKLEIHAENATGVIKAHIIVDDEIMSFACHDHVVIAVESQLARSARLVRGHGRDAGDQRRLAFLATERAAHPATYHCDVLGRTLRRACHHRLDLVRVLCRAMNQHATVFLRNSHCDVAFEIELILTTQRHASCKSMRRRVQRTFRVAATQCFTGQHE